MSASYSGWTIVATALLVAVGVCLMQAQEQRPQGGVISGRVTDAATGAVVPFQNVVVVGTHFGARTDNEGRFILRNIPDGVYEVRVSGIGYASVSTTVKLRKQQNDKADDLSLSLRQEDVAMAEVEISVAAETRGADMPVSLRTLSMRALSTAAGSMDDAARALTALPGVAPMRLERNDLIVRGGAPSENLFMVDNFEVPTISHFSVQGAGAGASSMIGTDLIERATFSAGGFGVRSGDRLSSVVSLSLRNGDREAYHTSATISATQFGMSAEGPLSSTGSFITSARRSFLEPVFKAYDMSFAPVYWDGMAKAVLNPGTADRMVILAVGASDRMQLFDDTEGKREENSAYVFGTQDLLMTGVSWEHVAKSWFTRVSLTHDLGSYTYYQPEAANRPVSTIDLRSSESALSMDVIVMPWSHFEASIGVKTKLMAFREHVLLLTVPWFLNVEGNLSSISGQMDTTGWKHSAYLQLTQTVGPLTISAGVRADQFTLIDDPFVAAPRSSLIWRISNDWELSASAGRYYQAPAETWLVNPYNRHLKHMGADQAVAGISVAPGGADWKILLEAYAKSYFNYPVSIEVPCLSVFNTGSSGSNFKDFGLDSLTSAGTGKSQGIELTVQRRFSETSPFSGSLSLAWSMSRFTALDEVERPADHDRRWILNAACEYNFSPHWDLSTAFRLYTGHPYTDVLILTRGTMKQYIAQYNQLRVGTNHSLDVRLTRRWKSGSASIDVFVDVQNLYNKKPFDTPELDLTTRLYRETAMVGIVPSVGIIIRL
ncbi:MAG TPA: TonB-dependent receptor [Bacteroidota bacterium]|nr:TonB-dependent receptor [Bacteroidota bacterium]